MKHLQRTVLFLIFASSLVARCTVDDEPQQNCGLWVRPSRRRQWDGVYSSETKPMKVRDLFFFGRNDRWVLLFTLALLVLVALGVLLGDREFSFSASTEEQRAPERLRHQERRYEPFAQPMRAVSLFPFDPNTADSTALLRLGLQAWQVRNVYKYRARGGIYRTPEDFARLYGLTQGQWRRLRPYIRIGSDYRPAAELVAHSSNGWDNGVYGRSSTSAAARVEGSVRHKMRQGETLDLNSADTTMLQRVPGIGSYFARRIVAYRERLGGFGAKEQLLEIDDFPPSSLPYFAILTPVQPLHVNALQLRELKRHPYLNYYQAKAICDYRRLHGPLHSLNELSLLPDFTADDLKRLAPYVAF